MPAPLDVAYLHELYECDPETGRLFHKSGRSGVRGGSPAGWRHWHNGIMVTINGSNYKASIVIWAMVNGRWPAGPPTEIIEHSDRDQFNNKISNLRLATVSQNQMNKNLRKDNQTNHTGVHYSSREWRYKAYIKVNYKRIHLGTFMTLEEAVKARREAELKYFGEFAPKE